MRLGTSFGSRWSTALVVEGCQKDTVINPMPRYLIEIGNPPPLTYLQWHWIQFASWDEDLLPLFLSYLLNTIFPPRNSEPADNKYIVSHCAWPHILTNKLTSPAINETRIERSLANRWRRLISFRRSTSWHPAVQSASILPVSPHSTCDKSTF